MEVIGFDGGFTVRETTMDVRITVETIFENGTPKTHHPGHLSRPYGQAQPGEIGLLLEDVRTLLAQLQTAILLDQIKEISAASRICPDCTKIRAIHDYRPRILDTLFGRFRVKAPRIRDEERAPCRNGQCQECHRRRHPWNNHPRQETGVSGRLTGAPQGCTPPYIRTGC